MCGIYGIKGLAENERKKYFLMMSDSLRHRGPDEEGVFCDKDISLGTRRLSVIDLKTGSQPVSNEDGSLILVCNGEIYNFREVKEGLIKKGHAFRANSDVEVLVHLYEDYGEEMLCHIKGMFSFAIWDKKNGKLFIARDRFGIKPLYYYENEGMMIFASELKALTKVSLIPQNLNPRAVDLYFSLDYVPSPHCIIGDVRKLEPGCRLTYQDGRMRIARYWDLNFSGLGKRSISGKKAEDECARLLKESVKAHMVSDVPLGVFLSGGIDSSSLVALMSGLSRGEITTFTMGFEEDSFDESRYAALIARKFQTKHHSYLFTLRDFIDIFEKVAGAMDEPLADLSFFPTYALSKFARENVKVVLSGEGGDEIFMGYQTYKAHKYARIFNCLPALIGKGMNGMAGCLPTSFAYFSPDFKLKQFCKGLEKKNPLLRHFAWMGPFTEEEKSTLFSRDFKNIMRTAKNGAEILLSDKLANHAENKNIYRLIQYADIFGYLSENILVKADRASMLNSLEMRVPYLDHELVEFLWEIDADLVYQKRLLKRMMKGILPGTIIGRPKKGFPIPFSAWFMEKSFFNRVHEFFNEDFIKAQGIFNGAYIARILNEHAGKKKDNRKKLGAYLMFQLWHRNWMEKDFNVL